MDPAGLAESSLEIFCGSNSLGYFYRLQPLDGSHRAHPTFDLDLSLVHRRLCDVRLGRMDAAEFWHAGQLPTVGHHRHSGIGQDVVAMIISSWWAS
jgi:hypothetical protein